MRLTIVLAASAFLIAGCEDPGAKVAPATVEAPPTQEAAPADKAKPTSALAIHPSNSKIEFVGAKVTRSHEGGFTDFAGTVELAEPVEQSLVDLTIQTASLYADEEKLTKHLKSPDFFDVEKFPTATFTSTRIEKTAQGHAVTGNLTLRGVTKQISFPATINASEGQVSADAEFSINRKDFGIDYPGMADDLIRDLVVIKLKLALPGQG